uniref:Prenylcysteine lyase domain-containing protein n=1 Tax=Trichobilharzia regenti TaxID=157069 RepID=A0AA85KA87_TRIRE|nr:unnamed protein product [Trichobilharzia regenti]
MQQQDQFRVAVVGGGVGGASSAYYLRQLFGNKVSITLFEQSGRIGGRMKTVPFCGDMWESGASVFHSSNHYMMSFAKKFKIPFSRLGEADRRIFFYGEQYKSIFSNINDSFTFLTPFRLFWHYGVSILNGRLYTASKVELFTRIYSLQNNGNCYTTPALLLKALSEDFVEMTKYTYADWLRKKLRVGEKYINEFAFGILSNNYCQSLDTHAFVGLISSACTVSDVFTIDGGVEQIPQKLVETALADNPTDAPKQLVHATVKKITRMDNNRLCLSYELADTKQTEESSFDYVILSMPLHQESKLATSDDIKLPQIKYHEMCRTLLTGSINYSLFGLPQKPLGDNQIVSFLPVANYYTHEKHPIRSIMRLPVKSKDSKEAIDGIWSIYSEPKDFPDAKSALSKLLLENPNDEHNRIDVVRWLAYPTYHPVVSEYIVGYTFII